MVSAITRPIFWEGLFLFFVGLGMTLISIYIHASQKTKLQNTQNRTVV
jgi:hypothetical protein